MSFSACVENKKEPSVTLTFMETNGEVIDSLVLSASSSPDMINDPFKLGFIFRGWYYDVKFEEEFSIKDGFRYDTFIYAKWEAIDSLKPSEKVEWEYHTIGGSNLALTKYLGDDISVTIPNVIEGGLVKNINAETFFNTDVEAVIINSSIEVIEEKAFVGASKLKWISVDSGNAKFYSDKGLLYNKDKTVLKAVPCKNTFNGEEYFINNDILRIEKFAFWKSELDVRFSPTTPIIAIGENVFDSFAGKVTLSENVELIKDKAFFNATCMVDFGQDSSIKSITSGAFTNYQGKEIILPSSVIRVEEHAFNNCGSEIIKIGENVTSIASYAFYGCTAKVIFDSNNKMERLSNECLFKFAGEIYLLPIINEIIIDCVNLDKNLLGEVFVYKNSSLTHESFGLDVNYSHLLKKYEIYPKN